MDLPLTDIAKNSALTLRPIRRYYARRRSRAGCASPADAAYPLGVFEKHREAIEKVHPISGRVLEIGPGGSLVAAALFVAHGASEAVCIDVEPWLADEGQLYAELGLDVDVLSRVKYEPRCPLESAAFEDASFDIAFSHACLEHVAQPAAALGNLSRMMMTGGVTTHEIDLRDHRDFARPLRFLKHGDAVWQLATSRRPATPNRWRASDYEREFTNVGFELVDLKRTTTVPVTEQDRQSFALRFRTRPLEDLETTTIFITAVKR